jgi:alkaline phosphatase D
MKRRSLVLGAAALAGCQGRMPVVPDAANTANAAGAGALQRIAFGSCIDQAKPQPLWPAVLEARPDLFIFAGDNVYASPRPWRLDALQAAYAQLAADPGFDRLRRTVPLLATWDDHDYGVNDGGAAFKHKQASKEEFLRFWGAGPDDPRHSHGGVYASHSFGPPGRRLQVILLDTRWFRSDLKPTDQHGAAGKERYVPDDDATKTMLGEAQWGWLEERLREEAQLRLIVSSIQVLAEGHGWERWGNLPLQRQRLFDLIQRTQAHGVVFLSGDRHLGALYREPGQAPYPLYELTSSGMTHTTRANASEDGPNRLGGVVSSLHFGMVEVDWPGRRLRLTLRGRDGRFLLEHSLSLDDL